MFKQRVFESSKVDNEAKTKDRENKHKQAIDFDKRHIDSSDIVIMVMPAGKSAHLELGYSIGMGKEAHILFDVEPDRFDLMYNFVPVDNIHFSIDCL
jgi:nucleoside 2-deoxyribosyltransferase